MWGFIVKFGIKAAIKKYGKAAIMRIAKNHGLIKKEIPKKIKGLTAKQEAKRTLMIEKKKAAIALKKWQEKNLITGTRGAAKSKVKPKVKEETIGMVKQNFGKARPYGLTKSQKEGIAYLNATRGPGHTLKDLKRIQAKTKKSLAMKNKKP